LRPVSAAWGRTIVGSHRPVFRARVCETFQTGTNPAGTQIRILGGDVTLDGSAKIRSTLDMLTPGAGMWPKHSNSLLMPFGNEIYIERGIKYRDDLIEYVGLGYFRVDEPGRDDPPDGPIQLSGSDRMATIIDARLIDPVQFVAGVTLGHVIATLVQQVYPSAVIEWDDATDDMVLTRSVIADGDRYEWLDKLIRSYAKIWYWDHRGVLVIRSLPDATQPVWVIDSGPGGVLVKVAENITRRGVYNAIVASGESVGGYAPARAVAYDSDPSSPTYWGGRFGPVPGYLTSGTIQTRAQAIAAAKAELRRRIGLPHTIDLSTVPNAAVEPYDPVGVRIPGEGMQTHVLERIGIPLDAKTRMDATTREQTTVLITTD
jgi:hypothetical protein